LIVLLNSDVEMVTGCV